MDVKVSLDTKEWLQTITKPRKMTVQDFLACLRYINHLSIPYMPAVDNASTMIHKFTEAELAQILRKAGPKAWRKAQIKHAGLPADIQ